MWQASAAKSMPHRLGASKVPEAATMNGRVPVPESFAVSRLPAGTPSRSAIVDRIDGPMSVIRSMYRHVMARGPGRTFRATRHGAAYRTEVTGS